MAVTHGGVQPTRHDCNSAVPGCSQAPALWSVTVAAQGSEPGVEDKPRLRAESTQSPHCIAQQGTTVRNSVEEKRPLTCDDVQNAWSAKPRVLLCKQGVVGSSPIVSTTKES